MSRRGSRRRARKGCRANPGGQWLPIAQAQVGALVDLRCADVLGQYDVEGPFFLHDDGRWYRVDPPMQLGERVRATHFRYRLA